MVGSTGLMREDITFILSTGIKANHTLGENRARQLALNLGRRDARWRGLRQTMQQVELQVRLSQAESRGDDHGQCAERLPRRVS